MSKETTDKLEPIKDVALRVSKHFDDHGPANADDLERLTNEGLMFHTTLTKRDIANMDFSEEYDLAPGDDWYEFSKEGYRLLKEWEGQ